MPRHKMMSSFQLFQLVDEFNKNPADAKIQAKVLDACKSFPLVWSYALAGKWKECLLSLPHYITPYRMDRGVSTNSRRESIALMSKIREEEYQEEYLTAIELRRSGNNPKHSDEHAIDLSSQQLELLKGLPEEVVATMNYAGREETEDILSDLDLEKLLEDEN